MSPRVRLMSVMRRARLPQPEAHITQCLLGRGNDIEIEASLPLDRHGKLLSLN